MADYINHLLRVFLSWLPILAGMVLPLIKVARGKTAIVWFFIGWAMIIGSFAVFTVIVPYYLAKVDMGLAVKIGSYFPDSKGVIAMVFFGWFFSGVSILAGVGVRKFAARGRM